MGPRRADAKGALGRNGRLKPSGRTPVQRGFKRDLKVLKVSFLFDSLEKRGLPDARKSAGATPRPREIQVVLYGTVKVDRVRSVRAIYIHTYAHTSICIYTNTHTELYLYVYT